MATPKNQKSGKNSQPPIELEPAPAAHIELVGILNEVTADTVSITFAHDMVILPRTEVFCESDLLPGDSATFVLPLALAMEKGLMDAVPVEAVGQPETVTFFGFRNFDEDTGNDIYFVVHYNDGEETVVEFFIPKEHIISEGKDNNYPEEDERRYITVSRAYAIEAGMMDNDTADTSGTEDAEDTEPGASLVPNDKHWLKQETVTVTQELTQREKAEYADCMANLDNEIEELEAERDRISKSLKKRIDAMEEERRQLSKVVREGKEEREIFCDKCADYNTCEMVWTDAHPPHDEVKRQKMTSEERQFPLEKKSRPDAQPQPQEVQPSEDVAEAALEGEDMDAIDEHSDAPSCSGCGQQYTADGSCDGCVDFINYTPVATAESSQCGAVQ